MLDREALLNQSWNASIHRFWMHSVGIINGVPIPCDDPTTGKPTTTEEFGSGCAARWGTHRFILTAKHVLEDATPGDLRILYSPTGGPEWKSFSNLTRADVVDGIAVSEHNAAIHRCEWEDLALITSIPRADGPQYVEFFDLSQEWIDPGEGESLHCFGFPADSWVPWETKLTGRTEHRSIAVSASVFYGNVIPEADFPTRGFDSKLHYLVPFIDARKSQHPRGYSGAAMWWESDQHKQVWRPAFKFAGICTSWYPKRRLEQVVKASVVRRFVEEVFGPA